MLTYTHFKKYRSKMSYLDLITMMAAQSTSNKSFELYNALENLKAVTQLEWFSKYGENGLLATWLSKYTVMFSLIMTRWGLCFNFNMIAAHELLNVNETSSDFHYEANIKNLVYVPSLDSNTLDLNKTYPWRVHNNQRSLIFYLFKSSYIDKNPFVIQSGYHVIFHSNFEFPFTDEENHLRIGTKEFLTVDINPVVYEADDSMDELSVEE
jgi:hypothetical protein